MNSEVISGNRIGIDVGTVRIGLALAASGTQLALPLETIQVQEDGSDLSRLIEIFDFHQVTVAYVGLPLLMSGKEGAAAKMARSYARRISRKRPRVQVRLVDERLTSSTAHSRLQQAGLTYRQHRTVVDQIAATVLLEQALNMERTQCRMSGQLVIG